MTGPYVCIMCEGQGHDPWVGDHDPDECPTCGYSIGIRRADQLSTVWVREIEAAKAYRSEER